LSGQGFGDALEALALVRLDLSRRCSMWTRIDDTAPRSAKLNVLSDAAFRMWSIVLVDSRTEEKIHLGGLVLRECLETIVQRRWRGKRLAKLVTELENATAGGKSGKGLWEPVDAGWQIHDWAQYGPPQKPSGPSVQELGRKGGQASAAARRARQGTAIPTGAKNRPSRTGSESTPEPVSELVRVALRPAVPEATEAPDPDPDHKSPKPSFGPRQAVRLVSEVPEARKAWSAEEIDEELQKRRHG
jgi:hypothetical protein